MAIKHQGEEIVTWIHNKQEISAIIQKGHEVHSAGNFVTADGVVIQTADGYIFNVKE